METFNIKEALTVEVNRHRTIPNMLVALKTPNLSKDVLHLTINKVCIT